MRHRTPQKTGVPGVLCVPQAMKPSNGVALSHGTQLAKDWNTWCSEHQWCSVPGGGWRNTSGRIEAAPAARQAEHDAGPVLSCWPLLMGCAMEHKQARARGIVLQPGVRGGYV